MNLMFHLLSSSSRVASASMVKDKLRPSASLEIANEDIRRASRGENVFS